MGARRYACFGVGRSAELEDGEHQDDGGDGREEHTAEEDHGHDDRDADDGREDAEEEVLSAASVRVFRANRGWHVAR
jgi:hypothetical protein